MWLRLAGPWAFLRREDATAPVLSGPLSRHCHPRCFGPCCPTLNTQLNSLPVSRILSLTLDSGWCFFLCEGCLPGQGCRTVHLKLKADFSVVFSWLISHFPLK